ncbi:MAG: hypothetical protein IJ174_06680 [Clostridia bacterium]|nr:hypothetical protein [Clostridia bacterium]
MKAGMKIAAILALLAILTLAPAFAEEARLVVEGGDRTLYRNGQEYIVAKCHIEGLKAGEKPVWNLLSDASEAPVMALSVDEDGSATVYLITENGLPENGEYASMIACAAGDFEDVSLLSVRLEDAPMGPLWELSGMQESSLIDEGGTVTVSLSTDPKGWAIPGEEAAFTLESLTTELGMPCDESMVLRAQEGDKISLTFPHSGLYLARFAYNCANFHMEHTMSVTVRSADGRAPVSALPDAIHMLERQIYTYAGEPFQVTAVLEPEGDLPEDAVAYSEIRFNGKWQRTSEMSLSSVFTIDGVGIYPCMYRLVIGNTAFEAPFYVIVSPEGRLLNVPEDITVESSYPTWAESGAEMGNGFLVDGYHVSWRVSAFLDGELFDDQHGVGDSAYTPITLVPGKWRFVLPASDDLGHTKTAEASLVCGGEMPALSTGEIAIFLLTPGTYGAKLPLEGGTGRPDVEWTLTERFIGGDENEISAWRTEGKAECEFACPSSGAFRLKARAVDGGMEALGFSPAFVLQDETSAREKEIRLPADCVTLDARVFIPRIATSVVCNEGLETIESGVLSNAKILWIYIPKSVSFIEPDAFDGCSAALTIAAPSESYAAQYAMEHGILLDIRDSAD